MKKIFWIILSLLVLSGLAFSATDFTLRTDQIETTGFPEVAMTFSAWGENGLPITDLTASDVTLSENQGAPFHPASLTLNKDAPLAVALVLDISGSMQGQPLVVSKVAAARFLDRLTENDLAALMAFSNSVDPDPAALNPAREVNFNQNLTPVYDLIEALAAEGGTELYHAVEKAVGMTSALPEGHRAVLVLSDGVNEPADAGDPDDPITLAQENGIPVYVIGLGNQIDEPYLRRLASETGGYFRLTPKSSELAQTFDDMAALLKTQYTLTYTSTLEGGDENSELTVSIDAQGSEVSETIALGPLPAIHEPEPTQEEVIEPTSTQTDIPTPTTPPTLAATIAPTPTQAPKGVFHVLRKIPWWGWVLGAVVLVILAPFSLFSLLRRKPKPEKCANCGFEMTGKKGPCSQCGSTRRLPKS